MRGKLRPEQLAHLQAFVSEVYETEHPVVRVHPETGEPALLLGGFAQRLVGHSLSRVSGPDPDPSGLCHTPENIVRWHWQEGDVAIWDNRATQHYAIADYADQRRRMQRVTTAGIPVVGLDGRIEPGSPGGRQPLLPRSLNRPWACITTHRVRDVGILRTNAPNRTSACSVPRQSSGDRVESPCALSKRSVHSRLSGRPRWYPWANRQPSARSPRSWTGFSTPSPIVS